jgi:hypothetical protein
VGESAFLDLSDGYRRFHNEGLVPVSELVCGSYDRITGSTDVTAAVLAHRDLVTRSFERVDALRMDFAAASGRLQAALSEPAFGAAFGTALAEADVHSGWNWLDHYGSLVSYRDSLDEAITAHQTDGRPLEPLAIDGVTRHCDPLERMP